MKKYSLFLIIILLISVGQHLTAQDTETQKDKDAKVKQSIEQQKKAMAEQKKTQIDIYKTEKDQDENEDLKEKQEDMENSIADMAKSKVYMNMKMGRGDRNFPFVFEGQDEFNGDFMGDSERSTWDFSKTVKDNTFSRDYTFGVEKTAKSVVMSVMGDCKSGEIRIKIVMPSGKSYSDILIDESGNLNWRKSFAISETENQDKAGDWKFQISSAKATGFFKISLQTY
jgi:hypothetical protein